MLGQTGVRLLQRRPPGIGYAAAWIISQSVGAPNPSVAASGNQVVAAFTGRSGPGLAMFALAEGAAAIALVAVMTAAARAARRSGQRRAGLAAAAFGIAAAVVSWVELALGTWLISGLVPDRRTVTAGALYQAINRMDGAKMFLLSAMALAISQLARRSPVLPRWLALPGALLAAALVASGLGFLLLIPGLASAVYVSGVLLLIFVAATGAALRSRDTGAISRARTGRSRGLQGSRQLADTGAAVTWARDRTGGPGRKGFHEAASHFLRHQ